MKAALVRCLKLLAELQKYKLKLKCSGLILVYTGYVLPSMPVQISLRKHAYSNIWKIPPQKNWNFSDIKNSDIFHISAQNIDCGYSLEPPQWGGYNEYPQSMFYAVIRKIMYTLVNPSFTIQKWGLRGSKLYRHVFVMFGIIQYMYLF